MPKWLPSLRRTPLIPKIAFRDLMIVLLFGGFFMATAPDVTRHIDEITLVLKGPSSPVQKLLPLIAPWEDLAFRHRGILTYTQDQNSGKVVSVGALNWVMVINKDWGRGHTYRTFAQNSGVFVDY